MRRWIACTAWIVTVFAGSSAAWAQAPAEPVLDLSLEEALRRGLAIGEEVELARSDVEIARQQVRAARAEALPRVDAELSYQRTLETPFELGGDVDLGDGSDLPFGNENTWVGALTLSQPLYAGGTIRAGLEIARAFDESTGSRAIETYSDLALAITEAYYGAVLAARLADITEAQMRQVEQQLRQVRLEESVGNASKLDVLRAQVQRHNLEPELVAARNRRTAAILDLKRLINFPDDRELRLSDELASEGFVPIQPARIAELAAGWEGRAALRAAALEVVIERQRVELARAEFKPRADLGARFAEQALPEDVLPEPSRFNHDWSVSLAVRLPLFTGGRRLAELAIVEQELRQADLELQRLRESIGLDVVRTGSEVQRAIELIGARRSTVEQAEEVYRLTNLAFEQGVTSFLELDDARFDLREARANEAQALADYYLSLARFLRAAGAPRAVSTLRLIQTPAAQERLAPPGGRVLEASPTTEENRR